VLVVEDDALIAMLLRAFAAWGTTCGATKGAPRPRRLWLTGYRPDLVIVDAGLGRGSGVSAVEEILRAGPLAHLFLSGDTDRVRRRRPDAVVVSKPFREAELARAIDAALAAAPRPVC
jgi:DNA-binding response OmpR family regulator